jgi:thiosulfate reductase cytochrome b subunit
MPHASRRIYRHRLPVRVMHWINVVCLFVLLGSGLQIFNAHPALYWGEASRFGKPAFALTGKPDAQGVPRGELRIGKRTFATDGVLGASKNLFGVHVARGFPTWATIPGAKSLADGRRWHFFFAWLFVLNGVAYLLWSLASRHLSGDLWPTRADVRGFGRSVLDHLKFKHPTGEAAARYNVLQKLAYLAVILLLIPGVVLMGLAMSPDFDVRLGWLLDLVGGRQSARTWHFIFAMALLAFVAIHVFMVLVSGPVNQVRSMLTGRYDVPLDRPDADERERAVASTPAGTPTRDAAREHGARP